MDSVHSRYGIVESHGYLYLLLDIIVQMLIKQDSSGVRERVVKDKRSKTMFNQQESSP